MASPQSLCLWLSVGGNKKTITTLRAGLLVFAVAALVASPAYSQTAVDPEVLFMGTGSGTCFSGSCPVFGNEVNGIPASTVSIFENGMGQPALVSPLLMIVGIPNFSSSAPGIASVSTGTGQLGGANLFGGSWNTGTGFAGNYTSGFAGSVYQFVGLAPPASASESFGNWSLADKSVNNITATSFAIFVYTLNNTGLTGGTGITVKFASGGLPVGSFIVAYGCSATTTNMSGTTVCNGTGNTYGTPFTQSGMVTLVPEPGTMALFGSGLLALGGFLRRGKRNRSGS